MRANFQISCKTLYLSSGVILMFNWLKAATTWLSSQACKKGQTVVLTAHIFAITIVLSKKSMMTRTKLMFCNNEPVNSRSSIASKRLFLIIFKEIGIDCYWSICFLPGAERETQQLPCNHPSSRSFEGFSCFQHISRQKFGPTERSLLSWLKRRRKTE